MSERKVLNVSVGRLGFSTWGETSRSSGRGGAVYTLLLEALFSPTALRWAGLSRLLPITFSGGWAFAKPRGWSVPNHLCGRSLGYLSHHF